MKYRLIKREYEHIIISEHGRVATICQADEIDVGDGRRSVIEWYEEYIPLTLLKNINDSLSCSLEDLPKYLNVEGEIPQKIVRQRLKGSLENEVLDGMLDMMFEWLNESKMYYEDSTKEYTDPSLLDVVFKSNEMVQDDTLYSEYF